MSLSYQDSVAQFPKLHQTIDRFLEELNSDKHIYVAYSGGLDSTVLLHLLKSTIQSKPFPQKIIALHVDHGLQSVSREWAQQTRLQASDWQVEYYNLRVDVGNLKRKGVEAAARKARYQALFSEVVNRGLDGVLVTAHHQRDQVETVMLNLARGTGVTGLAAMPDCIEKLHENDLVPHCRPLLHIQFEDLKEYAALHQLSFIEDPTNQDCSLRRNFIRHQVIPIFEQKWPEFQNKVAEASEYMQEALELLDSYAAQALKGCDHNKVYLALPEESELSWEQQKNLIRYWLKSFGQGLSLASKHFEWVKEALDGFAESQNHGFVYKLKRGELRVYKNRLYYLPFQPSSFHFEFISNASLIEFLESCCSKELRNKGFVSGCCFSFKSNALKHASKIILRSIVAGDKVDRKRLKAFFQLNSIPVWERQFWPVLDLNNGQEIVVLGMGDNTKDGVKNKFDELKLSDFQRLELCGFLPAD